MSLEASHNPSPMALPPCWVTSKTIGPIVVEYDGPTLTGSTITLSFTGGLTQQVASFVEDFSVEYPNRHIITFDEFVPGDPTTEDDKVIYNLNILFADGRNISLHYGTWQLMVLEI